MGAPQEAKGLSVQDFAAGRAGFFFSFHFWGFFDYFDDKGRDCRGAVPSLRGVVAGDTAQMIFVRAGLIHGNLYVVHLVVGRDHGVDFGIHREAGIGFFPVNVAELDDGPNLLGGDAGGAFFDPGGCFYLAQEPFYSVIHYC
jgi:hypothetical protein